MGSKSRSFLTVIPYSSSVPITFGIAIASPHRDSSEVLPRVDVLDRTLLPADPGHERPHVDDALALAARDPCPVVGVGRVRKVLVLLELLLHGLEHVIELDAALVLRDQPLHGLLLGARHDVLAHGA